MEIHIEYGVYFGLMNRAERYFTKEDAEKLVAAFPEHNQLVHRIYTGHNGYWLYSGWYAGDYDESNPTPEYVWER